MTTAENAMKEACQSAAELQLGMQLMTTQECSVFLGKSLPWIYGKVKEGKIPFCRVGSEYRFQRSDIMAWIKAGTSAGI